MKRIYQAPSIFIDSVIFDQPMLAGSRLVGGGPLDDDVNPFPESVIVSTSSDDGMSSSMGQGSGGSGNRSNTSNLWDDEW